MEAHHARLGRFPNGKSHPLDFVAGHHFKDLGACSLDMTPGLLVLELKLV